MMSREEALEEMGRLMTMPRRSKPGGKWTKVYHEAAEGYLMERTDRDGNVEAWMNCDDYEKMKAAYGAKR